MYRNNKRILQIAVYAAFTLVFAFLVPPLVAGLAPVGAVAFSGGVYILLMAGANGVWRRADEALRVASFVKSETRLLGDFAERLRFSFTTNDLIDAFRDTLEYSADCTVILIDMPKHYSVYNSMSAVGTDPNVFSELIRHYDNWREGYFFFDEDLDLVSDYRKARGFFMVRGGLHVYVFLRYLRVMEREIFPTLFEEFGAFLKRNETIEKMYAIAAVSKEWSSIAETQRSFLPKRMPEVKGLELAALFRPLVNVSGDYYDALPIDEHRTLLVLGDVSGKGLAAALIMGIVVNTIRILEKKDDLPSIVRAVDAAIKGMSLQDKYTVLFIGLVDTSRMTITYVNASMADPLVISETRAGRQIRRLKSNCSLIGIIDLDEIGVSEAKLFPGDVILIASDGVSEVPDQNGNMLGDSETWTDYVTEESARPLDQFVNGLSELALRYAEGAPLRDDLTVLAAKVREEAV